LNAPPSLWDLETGKEIPLIDVGKAEVLGLTFSADGRQLLGALWENGELRLRDLRTGQALRTLPWPKNRITQLGWSPDARCFVTIEDSRYARVWTRTRVSFVLRWSTSRGDAHCVQQRWPVSCPGRCRGRDASAL
jgi:WD40 repeat protein